MRRYLRKKHKKRSILSASLSLALASGLLWGGVAPLGTGGVAAAYAADAEAEEDIGRQLADEMPAVVADSSDQKKLNLITMKTGASSGYGQESISFVDSSGKQVDIQEEAEKLSGITTEDVQEMMPSFYVTRSSYSNKDALGPVRDQAKWNLCWAFAATAVLEANILTGNSSCSSVSMNKDQLDLSERHMGWFANNTLSKLADDPTKNLDGARKTSYAGGNFYKAAAYLARGSGMTLEEGVPYGTRTAGMGTVAETDRYDSVVTLHDLCTTSYNISMSPETSIDNVKRLLSEFGAAGCSYLSKDNCYSKKNDPGGVAYYQKSKGTNHAVCIVGYDDDYAVSNFTGSGGKPPKPGAWLVRNSWGSSWGNDGYFWLSYYDASINYIFSMRAADSVDYGDIYQYDATGRNAALNANAAANVFQARRDDVLKSVGIYTNSATGGGKIQVYTSDTAMVNPAAGTLRATYDLGPNSYPGYHVIDLDDLGSSQSVSLKKGQYFSIVYTQGSGGKTMYCFEGRRGCKSSAGQSYYFDGSGWKDSYKLAGNACIKAIMTSEADTAELAELITEVRNFSSADAGMNQWIQKELQAAEAAKNAKGADDVASAVLRLKRLLSQSESYHIYTDATKTNGPGKDGSYMYLNGGSYKKDGVTTKHGAQTYHFSVDKVQSWKRSGRKMVSAYYGNYVVASTTTETKPELDKNTGMVIHPDTAAAQIVKTKLSGSKVTITPLKEGEVYVWVLYYPKGGKCNENDEDDYAVTKVTVGPAAPTTVKLYDTAEKAANCTDTTITRYLATAIPQGGSTSVYVSGITGKKTSKVNTLAATKLDGTHYEPVVPVKYRDYITVDRDANEKNKFTINVAEGILDQFKIKTNKTLSVNIPFYCIRNSKKANFKVIIGNPVKSMDFAAGTDAEVQKNGDILEVKIKAPDARSSSVGTIVETKTLYNDVRSCTDGTKVLRMAKADDLIFNTSNVPNVSTKLEPMQKKISLSLQKDKMTYKITAARNTPSGTTVYFVISHNAYLHQSGAGYQIVKVTLEAASEQA